MSATRALIRKEWRGLRGIRWAGLGLGGVVAIAFSLGAEHSSRTPQVVILDALPASLALAVWPLVALLATAQAFVGDRAAGTETFLIERPVARGRIFLSRLASAYGSLAAVIVASAAATLAVAWLMVSPDRVATTEVLRVLGAGAAFAATVLLCGIAAASVARSPLVALILGGFLAALPAFAWFQLAARFPAAEFAGVRLGNVWPLLLPPTYLLAGWIGATRGEPMGRGAAARVGAVLAVGLTVAAAGFLISAPLAMRYEGSSGTARFAVNMPRSGPSILLRGSSDRPADAGWIVDVQRGKRLAFLGPTHAPPGAAGWNPDGTRLAVFTDAGNLGAFENRMRVEIFGADGRRSDKPIRLEAWSYPEALAWCGDRVAMTLYTRDDTRLMFADPGSHTVEPGGFDRPRRSLLHLFGPTADGALWLRAYVYATDPPPGPGRDTPTAAELYRIDPLSCALGARPVVTEEHWLTTWRFQGRISRSGRYWVRETLDDQGLASRSVVEPATGEVAPAPHPTRNLFWLAGDNIAWTETAGDTTVLMLAQVGRSGRPIRAWRDADPELLPSPGGGLLVVNVRPRGTGDRDVEREDDVTSVAHLDELHAVPSNMAYVVEEDRWIDVSHVWTDGSEGTANVRWAGPNTVLRTRRGSAELVSLDRPDDIVRLW